MLPGPFTGLVLPADPPSTAAAAVTMTTVVLMCLHCMSAHLGQHCTCVLLLLPQVSTTVKPCWMGCGQVRWHLMPYGKGGLPQLQSEWSSQTATIQSRRRRSSNTTSSSSYGLTFL